MKKHIGILIGQIVQIGGVVIAALEETRALRRLGYEAELLVLRENKKFKHDDFTRGIPIRWLSREYPQLYRINFKIPFFSFFSLFHILGGPAVSAVMKKGEYDALIAHETYNCLSALTVKKRLGIPYLGYIWDPVSYILPRVYRKRALGYLLPVLEPIGRYLDRTLILNSTLTLTCSQAHIERMAEIAGEREKLKVLYPGCYPAETLPLKRENFILALTKWDIGKNPFFLLDVLNHLKNREIRLVVAGNWVQEELKREFIRQIVRRNLNRRIEFIGRVNHQEKAELFSRARVLIHPIFEAFGMMCLEAAGSGCPFIIPQGSGVTELFPSREYIVFPGEGEVEGFASRIESFFSDPDFHRQKSKLVWEVAKKHSWEEHGKNLARIIESAFRDLQSVTR